MPQKRRGASRTQNSTPSGAAGSARGARRRSRTTRSRARVGRQERRGRVVLAGQDKSRGLLAEARDMAQSVGETTLGTARGLASGARGAALGVARGTQEAATQVVDKVRENPWPALLIGAGATWMIIEAARGESQRRGRGGRRRSNRDSEGGTLSLVSGAGRSVVGAGRSVGGQVGRFVRDNPLLAGAATVGVGLAIGLAMPSTEIENQLFGDAREKMLRRAKRAARGTIRDATESVRGLTGRSAR